jgi:voltage-gated potassium channel
MLSRVRRFIRDEQFRRQIFPLALLVLLVAIGTVGYMAVEGWSPGDALYMTIITLSTVGYMEVHQLDGSGRVLTSLLILIGVGVLFLSVTNLWTWIVEMQMSGRRSQQQMRNHIHELEHHVIVCGYGRVGQTIADELVHDRIPFVVIEANPDRVERCVASGRLTVTGDATQDEILVEAGIERARGLAIALDDDAKNVFIALTGRALNPKIEIVARAGRRESESKLVQAGAHRVVSPYAMSGQRMAALFTRPSVIDFIDTTLHRDNVEYNLEEFSVPESSGLVGQTVQDVQRVVGSGVMILAIIGASGLIPSPSPDYRLCALDTLIIVGGGERLKRLNEIARTARGFEMT